MALKLYQFIYHMIEEAQGKEGVQGSEGKRRGYGEVSGSSFVVCGRHEESIRWSTCPDTQGTVILEPSFFLIVINISKALFSLYFFFT